MDLTTIAALFGIATPAIGGLIWLVRLEGSVRGHEQRFEVVDRRHDELREDVKYIRDRIDRALNGHG